MTASPHSQHGACIGVLLCTMLAACATQPVPLEVHPVAVSAAPNIGAPVAYLHSQAFRERLDTIEPYGNRYYVPLKTGEASDRALRDAYVRLLASAREIGSLNEARAPAASQPVIATLEPSIVRLDYFNASGRMWGPYYAEIVYGFTLYDGDGGRIADWRVSGFGEFDMNREVKERRPGLPRGEMAVIVESPRRAVENGIARFVAGFERVPELMRLARNFPLVGATASPAAQLTRTVDSGIEIEYPGVLSLLVERVALPTPPKDVVVKAQPTPNLLPIRVTLRNLSTHRLALDPADAQWLPAGTPKTLEPISAIPGRVVPGILAGRPFGISVGVMSPGIGMLPALFAALVSAAENARQQQELAAWDTVIGRDLLTDGTVAAGDTRSGLVYFPRPPESEGGAIVIPIVDLDHAVRYRARVPLAQ